MSIIKNIIDQNREGFASESDATTGTSETKLMNPARTKTVADLKVDKVTDYSLVADTEISKIHASGSDDQDLSNLVVKVTDYSLTADTEISKIHSQNTDTTVGGVDVAEDTDSFILTGSTGIVLTVDETTLISNKANNGANSDITSMTGLSDDGIPLAKVANAASDGANSDITSMTGLSNDGIPLAKVADAAGLSVAQEYTKTQNFNATTLSDGANIAWDLESNQVCKVTLGGNRTLDNPTNQVDGATYILRVIQDGTGSRTLGYGTAYLWPGGTAPTLTTTAAAIDILTFISDGTNMFGVASLEFS